MSRFGAWKKAPWPWSCFACSSTLTWHSQFSQSYKNIQDLCISIERGQPNSLPRTWLSQWSASHSLRWNWETTWYLSCSGYQWIWMHYHWYPGVSWIVSREQRQEDNVVQTYRSTLCVKIHVFSLAVRKATLHHSVRLCLIAPQADQVHFRILSPFSRTS